MSINIQDKTVKIINFSQNQNDPNYGTCLWATFTIDPESLSLSIRSDAGDMQYAWQNIGDNSPAGFLRFLSRLDKDYFLCKMSNQTRFNFDETVKHLSAYLEDNRPELANEVRKMRECPNQHTFIRDYLAFDGSHTDDLECIVMDYPIGHQALADIFECYVQPELIECISPAVDAYFMEVEYDYTTEDLSHLLAMLDPKQRYVPVTVDSEQSSAFGFVESVAYEANLCELGADKLFAQEMAEVLSDMNKEAPDQMYTFAGVRTHLFR